MRARVLITDGSRTIDLLWLEHTGSDVYWGMPHFPEKRSYHASGEIHTKGGVRTLDAVHHTPLRQLKGLFQLTSIGLQHATGFVRRAATKYEYSRRKADTLLVVDARSVPSKAQTCIGVGLLEPHNAKALMFLLSLACPGEDLRPQQLLISSSVEPWVYASVYWWVKGAA
jgi:hypothetical protein